MDPIRKVDEYFLSELGDILAWAESEGITRRSRFHTYKKNIEWLGAHDGEDERVQIHSQLSSQGKLTEILSTMTESIELVETIPTLRKCSVTIPEQLLQRAFSGPLDAFREGPGSNEARNAMFELSVGAMAARLGLTPTLSTTNPDVSFEFKGRRVNIECKRVLSENTILRRLREGIKQLDKVVQRANSDVGIVAVSLSKIINAGDRFLVSQSPHEDLSLQLHHAMKANEQTLGRMHRPSATGFLFYVSSAAYVPGKGYSPIRAGTVFPLNIGEQQYLRELADALRV